MRRDSRAKKKAKIRRRKKMNQQGNYHCCRSLLRCCQLLKQHAFNGTRTIIHRRTIYAIERTKEKKKKVDGYIHKCVHLVFRSSIIQNCDRFIHRRVDVETPELPAIYCDVA